MVQGRPFCRQGAELYACMHACTPTANHFFIQDMTETFGGLLRHAAQSGLPEWQHGRNGLAAVLLMDQFSRHASAHAPV